MHSEMGWLSNGTGPGGLALERKNGLVVIPILSIPLSNSSAVGSISTGKWVVYYSTIIAMSDDFNE